MADIAASTHDLIAAHAADLAAQDGVAVTVRHLHAAADQVAAQIRAARDRLVGALMTAPRVIVPPPALEPVEQPVETPIDTPVETPINTPVETPIKQPVEQPVEIPAEAPVEGAAP